MPMTFRTALIATAFTASVVAGVSLTQPAIGQTDDKKLGAVHFETSCKPEAQALFDRAMLYQHSFWYRASQRVFEDVLKADPACGIAYWGIALSLLWNPHAAPPPKNLAEGAAALAKARGVDVKTQRERDYLDALGMMYADYDKVDHRTRLLAYAKAMEQLAERYPDDDEAQIFYALALNTSAPPDDKTYANQLKGAAILERIALRQPQHPGVAHYLIHLYDTPALADKGLEAARRYSKIAPAAAHAQHMPSHIFTRVGYWQESIASNAESARVAKADKEGADQLHAMDYLVYAYLQLGQDGKASAVIDEMNTVTGFSETFIAGPYALAASPARYAVERGDWKAAAALQVRPAALAQVQAITYFARVLGAARSGDPAAAQPDIAKLAELREKLREAKDAYWAGQVDIQWQIATAWVLYAKGKRDEALKAMSAAADAEDRTEKHPVTPGVPKPARELYGEMLLESGMPREALAAFEATLKKEPNRLGATVGAASAAEKAGDPDKARDYYAKVVAIAGDADKTRTDIDAARAFLAEEVVRTLTLLIALSALATPARSQSREVIGYAGVLGEWEVTATVTEKASGRTREYVGPLTMTHVGICTQEGPEEKTGEIRFQITGASRLEATLSVAGVECTYRGKLSDSYTGMMRCPDRPAVPLELWVK